MFPENLPMFPPRFFLEKNKKPKPLSVGLRLFFGMDPGPEILSQNPVFLLPCWIKRMDLLSTQITEKLFSGQVTQVLFIYLFIFPELKQQVNPAVLLSF